ncbi:MAG TPA: DUF4350 domain-containing protein [Cerasibacillus sp.]|uniref:DUF4350 domain-containing protein n=1 Tax=Cerasibacillus sp. TaxID=2498711 RepID=UPI002F400B20
MMYQAKKQNRKWWLIFIGLLGLFLVASYIIQSKRPVDYPKFASESPAPSGVKAFYTYMKKENESVNRWNKSPTRLSTVKQNQLLILIEPAITLTVADREAYREFIERGNTILLFSEEPGAVFDLEVQSRFVFSGQTIDTSSGEIFHANMKHGNRIAESNDADVLLSDDNGVIAQKQSIGKGELIVSVYPEWLRNDTILQEDHLPLLVHILNETSEGTILFDEYIHQEQGGLPFYSYFSLGFLLVLLQGGLLTLLWLWYRGKRFGPIETVRADDVRFTDESIRALARWHLRGQHYHDSLVIQAEFVKHLLQEKWFIPYQKAWHDITDTLKNRWEHREINVDEFITGLTTVLQKKKLSKEEYVLWSKQLDQLRIEVEKT